MTDSLPNFDTMWDYAQPAETEKRFRELLSATTLDEAYRLQLLTQIARAQGLQRRFDNAHRTLDEVAPHIDTDMRVKIRYLLERGRVYNSSKQPEKARPLFLQAWEVASAAGEDVYAVDAAHMMAIVEPGEQQLGWNLKALAKAEESPDPRAQNWRGSLYNNIGWTYHDQKDYTAALDMFQKALEFRQSQNQPREVRIARWCIARTLLSLGRVQEALDMQMTLHKEHEQLGESDPYVSEELGECLLLLGRADEARPHFARAYAELSQDPWLADNEPERLARLEELGR